MQTNIKVTDYLLVAITPLCWATDVVLARGVVGIIPPFSLAFWRWFVAFLVLLPFAFSHIRRDLDEIKRTWKLLFLLSILGISVFISLIYTAVQTTTAINVALIQTAMPVAIAISCYILYKEKTSVLQGSCLAVCCLGVCFVVLQGKLSNIFGVTFVLGDLLMLIATLMFGMYSALLQKKAPKLSPLSMLSVLSGLGALVLLPAHAFEVFVGGGFDVTLNVVSRIMYAAIFPAIVAYFCWMRGVSTIGAKRTGIFINLLPVFASILAIVFLGEVFRWFHLVGMCLIVSGMLAFNKFEVDVVDVEEKAIQPTGDRKDYCSFGGE